MTTYRFSTGNRFRWKSITYEVKRLLPGEQVNIEDIFTGATLVIDLPVLVQALFAGELEFAIDGMLAKNTQDGISTKHNYVTLDDCPEHLLRIARRRLEIISPLLTLEQRTDKLVRDRVQEIKAAYCENGKEHTLEEAVSVRSVYRWLDDYRRSGFDLRSLIPNTTKRGGKGQHRLVPEVETLIHTTIEDNYYVQERVTVNDIRDEVAVRVVQENGLRPQREKLEMPSRRTIARRIAALDTQRRLEAKCGKRTAKHALAQYEQTPYPDVPLERVEIDHTLSDLIVIDDLDNLPLGRLTLTYCLDMATRYPLGYYMGFEPPGYLAVMECLHHTICPKENVQEKYNTEHDWLAYGIPSTLVIDNGKEFIGKDLEDACLLLGIVLQQTPVKTPHFKAGVERVFGSLNTMLFHKLPGTTFSNIRERGDYDSIQQACVYLSDVDKMLHIFIADVYAEQFHRGLNGIPARRWEALTAYGFAPGLPPNAQELSILLGRTLTRVVNHYGIQFASLRYNCDELTTLRTRLKGEKAKIKYHPADLSRIYVYDPFECQYIQVDALDQEYTQGLSLWKHRVIRRAVLDEQDSVDIVALGQAKRKIQAIVDDGRRRKRQQSRSRIARWDTAGKPTRQIAEQVCACETTCELAETTAVDDALPDSSPTQIDSQMPLSTNEQTDTSWEISYPSLPKGSNLEETIERTAQDGQ